MPTVTDFFATETLFPIDDGAGSFPADSCTAALIAGYALRDANRSEAAERRFREAIAIDPSCAEAFGALGDLMSDAGYHGDSARAHERAAALEPDRADRLRPLAEAYAASGQPIEAAGVWRRILDRRPDSAPAHRALARLSVVSGDHDTAIRHFREALFLDAADIEIAVELARSLVDADEGLAAVELLPPLLRRQPDHAPAEFELGRAWLQLGEREKALAALRRSRDLDPEGGAAAGDLIARIEADQGSGLSRSYVRALFDRYADRFDQDLTVKLRYTAPQVLRTAVDKVLGPAACSLDVLDLGCGTGLAGVDFRPLAGRLHGVDLSPRMIDKARRRNLYDHLEAGDLTDVLARNEAAWDLIVAADVLVYVGDLAPVMRVVGAALRPGGLFAATTERGDGDGFALGVSRRYAHGPHHVRQAARAAGLEPVMLEDASPRWEAGRPVPGLLFILRRPARPQP
jgi:predicted TPR repeat methyltransferase